MSDRTLSAAVELPVQPSRQPSHGRNLEAPPWCYLLWGVPALLVFVSFGLRSASVISLTDAGIVWVVAVAWAGLGCLLNGRSCGRVHCRIDGIGFHALAIVGALNIFGLVSFDWNWYWLAFIIILIASFVPEIVWKKYS